MTLRKIWQLLMFGCCWLALQPWAAASGSLPQTDTVIFTAEPVAGRRISFEQIRKSNQSIDSFDAVEIFRSVDDPTLWERENTRKNLRGFKTAIFYYDLHNNSAADVLYSSTDFSAIPDRYRILLFDKHSGEKVLDRSYDHFAQGQPSKLFDTIGFAVPAHSKYRLFYIVESYYIRIDIFGSHPQDVLNESIKRVLLFSVPLAFILTIFLHSCFTYLRLRKKEYLLYILYLGGLLLYQSYNSGFSKYIGLVDLHQFWVFRSSFGVVLAVNLFYLCALVFLIKFVLVYLKGDIIHPRMVKLFQAFSWILIVGALCIVSRLVWDTHDLRSFTWVRSSIYILAANVGAPISLAVLGLAIYTWIRFRSRKAAFLTVSLLALVGGFLYYLAALKGLVELNPISSNTPLFGAALEALILATAISDKFSRLENKQSNRINTLNDQLQSVNTDLADKVKEKTKDIASLLENIGQGIVPLKLDSTRGLIIDANYSSHLHEILDDNADFSGEPFAEVVIRYLDLGVDEAKMFLSIVAGSLGEDSLTWEANLLSLPRQAVFRKGGATKHLELTYGMILDDQDALEKIIVIIRDVSLVKTMEFAQAAKEKDLQKIATIIALEPQVFADFIGTTKDALANAKVKLEILQSCPIGLTAQQHLTHIYQSLHTMKGMSRAYGMQDISDKIHCCEETIAALSRYTQESADYGAVETVALKEKIASIEEFRLEILQGVEDYQAIAENQLGRLEQHQKISVDLEMLKSIVKRLERTADDCQPASSIPAIVTDLKAIYHTRLETMLGYTCQRISRVAESLGKLAPTIQFIHDNRYVHTHLKAPLTTVMVHILRNSIDHGIEDPEARLALGKAERATIKIAVNEGSSESIQIEVSDDGRGLDLQTIAATAQAKNLVTSIALQTMSPLAVANLIFVNGFSTSEVVTDISGRGVGMAAIKSEVEEMGGSVTIKLLGKSKSRNHSFAIVIRLPASYFDYEPSPLESAS